MTSRNIAKTGSYPGADFYKVICDCTDSDHDLSMIVEVEDGIISIQFYKKVWAHALWCPITFSEKLKDWYGRIKIAWTVLTKGYAEYEGDFLIQSEEACEDFVEAIQNSMLKMRLQREEERKKWPKKECTNNED